MLKLLKLNLAGHKYIIKNLIWGVNECTASYLTSQNKVFTLYMIGLSQSISKIKTSGCFLKLFKDYAEHFTILGHQVISVHGRVYKLFFFIRTLPIFFKMVCIKYNFVVNIYL